MNEKDLENHGMPSEIFNMDENRNESLELTVAGDEISSGKLLPVDAETDMSRDTKVFAQNHISDAEDNSGANGGNLNQNHNHVETMNTNQNNLLKYDPSLQTYFNEGIKYTNKTADETTTQNMSAAEEILPPTRENENTNNSINGHSVEDLHLLTHNIKCEVEGVNSHTNRNETVSEDSSDLLDIKPEIYIDKSAYDDRMYGGYEDEEFKHERPSENNSLEGESSRDSTAIDVVDKPKLSYELQHGYRILKSVMLESNKFINWAFLDAVDDNHPDTQDYYDRIKKPMWLNKS